MTRADARLAALTSVAFVLGLMVGAALTVLVAVAFAFPT